MKINNPLQAQIPQLKQLWQQAFHEPMDSFLATAFSPERALVAEKEGQVVAALYWFDLDYQGHRLAYLYAIATEQAHQGQGIGKELLHAAHHHLKALGYAGTVLVPASESLFAFYKACGYETEIPGFCRQAVDFVGQQVSWEQYNAFRQTLLPPGSPLASEAVFRYLATYCQFYIGKNACLCAAPGGPCQELLPHTPTDKPFALFFPLAENIPAPTYFALPID